MVKNQNNITSPYITITIQIFAVNTKEQIERFQQAINEDIIIIKRDKISFMNEDTPKIYTFNENIHSCIAPLIKLNDLITDINGTLTKFRHIYTKIRSFCNIADQFKRFINRFLKKYDTLKEQVIKAQKKALTLKTNLEYIQSQKDCYRLSNSDHKQMNK